MRLLLLATLVLGAARPAAGAVTVTPSSATLEAGQTVQLASSLAGVSWNSSNTAVATVNRTGLVTAHAPGTATITAKLKNQRGTATITVTAPPPPPEEVCGNGLDDDGNGLVDENPPCAPPEELCGNGLDDDGDGLIDEDPPCSPVPPPTGCDGDTGVLVTGPASGTLTFCHTQLDGLGAFNPPTEVLVQVDNQVVYHGPIVIDPTPNAEGKYAITLPSPLALDLPLGDHPLRIALHFVRLVNGVDWHEWGDSGTALTWRVVP